MNRSNVYKLIDEEREYQNSLSHAPAEHDVEHSVADWLIFIKLHLEKAEQSLYYAGAEGALEEIRKIASLAVACMEHNDTRGRE